MVLLGFLHLQRLILNQCFDRLGRTSRMTTDCSGYSSNGSQIQFGRIIGRSIFYPRVFGSSDQGRLSVVV